MTGLDGETEQAIRALVYRLNDRGDADVEVIARSFMTELRARGWRPTEARTPWDYRNQPHGEGLPTSEETRLQVAETRRLLAEASIRRRTLAANPPKGDVA
jgi:hypothetical protein